MIKASKNDKLIVVNILSNAFDENYSVNYVVKQDANRKKRIRALMNYSFEICFLYGNVYLSDDKHACALILYPEKQKTTLRTILLDIRLMFSCIGLHRVNTVLRRNAKIKSLYPKQAIANLWFIGVNTKQQGKGIGSRFLNELISVEDSVNTAIYLETSMLQNLPFYKKLGFEIYNELNFGHPLYMLKRHCKLPM